MLAWCLSIYTVINGHGCDLLVSYPGFILTIANNPGYNKAKLNLPPLGKLTTCVSTLHIYKIVIAATILLVYVAHTKSVIAV